VRKASAARVEKQSETKNDKKGNKNEQAAKQKKEKAEDKREETPSQLTR
jgi:hypothetical protein